MSRSTPRRLLTALALTTTTTLGVTLLGAAPADARRWPGHPDRNLVTHTVKPGDTASGLSTRYHAWTREFIALNGHRLRVGDKVTVPVVVSAARKARQKARAAKSSKRKNVGKAPTQHTSRAVVRRTIERHAKKRGVPKNLALAVAWQESGWRQPVISSAGAIGVMQVLPSTGDWMSALAGERIRIRTTEGNIRAGTMLLRHLRAHTRHDRAAVAAYYEGLGGIKDGWYDETKHYVRSVMAIKRILDRTGQPTR